MPTETLSSNPLIAADLQTQYVLNGSETAVIGQYAYIKIAKTTLQGITEEEYRDFCTTIVEDSIYNWVSIICDDGTGIQFTGSQYIWATYGTITYEGVITDELGTIKDSGSCFEYESADANLQTYPANNVSEYTALAINELPANIYNTTGSENGLGGTIYAFSGTVIDHFANGDGDWIFDNIVVDTGDGTVMITDFYSAVYNVTVKDFGEEVAKAEYPYDPADFKLPEVGETANFITIYAGYSQNSQMAAFYLGANQSIFQMLEMDDPIPD